LAGVAPSIVWIISPIITPSAERIFSFPYFTHLATGIAVHTGIIDESRLVVIGGDLGALCALACQWIAGVAITALVTEIGVY